jgi:hypothetical protein
VKKKEDGDYYDENAVLPHLVRMLYYERKLDDAL